ncbi:chaplin [Thermobifida halotolerans]|uniref:Chaplin n=1 Tax=Thermobifida halotolerans TaxID=483545 RepID=A0A399G1W2_9ACTN|nr:chaplin family protein [Thermobifida halotolerans]UOE19212.1 chaplin [Thermobifida halotolerans]
MRKTMLATASTAVLTAGLVAGFASPAFAGQTVSGNQINIPVDVAVDVCGNAISVVGEARAQCTVIVDALQEASEDGEGGETTAEGGDSVASGNRINIPVDVAVDVCGNAISVVGEARAQCTEVAEALQEASEGGESGESGETAAEETGGSNASGNDDVLSDNEVNAPVNADVDVCGNSVAVLGSAEADCEETAQAEEPTGVEEGAETPQESGTAEEPADDKPAQETREVATDETLPVTGAALGGLVAAAVAALGGGGAAMYLSRRKKATED